MPCLAHGRCQPVYCVRADSLGHLYLTHTWESASVACRRHNSRSHRKNCTISTQYSAQITYTYWRRISAGAVSTTRKQSTFLRQACQNWLYDCRNRFRYCLMCPKHGQILSPKMLCFMRHSNKCIFEQISF